MFRKTLIALTATAALTGCTISVMDLVSDGINRGSELIGMAQDAALLIYTEDDAETLLLGDTQRRLNGEVSFAVEGPDWGMCDGLISERLSVISIDCENGYGFTDQLRSESTATSGVIEFHGNANGQEYVAFFGWGDAANEAALRAAFAAYVGDL